MSAFLLSALSMALAILLLVFIFGLLLPKSRKFQYSVICPQSVSDLWDKLIRVENYPAWRDNLRRVEIHKKNKQSILAWSEVPVRGKISYFQRKKAAQYKKLLLSQRYGDIYQAELEYLFSSENGQVLLTLNKIIHITNPVLRAMAYLKLNIKHELRQLAANLVDSE